MSKPSRRDDAMIDRIKSAWDLPQSPTQGNGSVCGIPLGEIGELSEKARELLGESSPTSPNSPGGHIQKAIYPEGSILADWMKYCWNNEESADAYIIGSILPVCGAILGRRVWIKFGDRRQYPNVFCMLAGKPGDRKSSVILLAEMLAWRVLEDESAFLPKEFSPETLFDEFEAQPDKIWIVDDANSVLTDFRKSQNGERVSSRILDLHDCKYMSDNYRATRTGKKADGARSRRPARAFSLVPRSTPPISRDNQLRSAAD
jgi:hypothetical protein